MADPFRPAEASAPQPLAAGLEGAGYSALPQHILYRSRLVPRAISTIGLVGGPIMLLSATSTIFGGWAQLSTVGTLCALPVAVFEFSVGLWLTFKGFKPDAALRSA